VKLRAKNLDVSDIEQIVGIIDGWSGKLSWSLLIDAIERRKHSRYTRQALHNHERIRAAFALRKQALSDEPQDNEVSPHTPEMQAAIARISRLEAENKRLKYENDRLLEQFVVWAYNAHLHNLTKELLSRPLPNVNRGQTEST
jgi:hypothetical protein